MTSMIAFSVPNQTMLNILKYLDKEGPASYSRIGRNTHTGWDRGNKCLNTLCERNLVSKAVIKGEEAEWRKYSYKITLRGKQILTLWSHAEDKLAEIEKLFERPA